MKRGFLTILLSFAIAITLSTTVLAQYGEPHHLKLLAVQDFGDHYEGSDAELFLELREGTGRVFLDTYPVTKMDTQISTRFAKEIACKNLKLDCDRYDFIFTIKSRSNIIGGPSAGAAMAALTAIAVLDLEHNEEIAITGTINSGATIGQVGGVKEKLESASKTGIKKVLIARGTTHQPYTNFRDTGNFSAVNETNSTLNLISYGKDNLSLDVMEVIDLREVIFQLTGKKLAEEVPALEQNNEYQEIMQVLQENLCKRNEQIKRELVQRNIVLNESILEFVKENDQKIENATKEGDYYSAASFCFGNNIRLKTAYYKQLDVSAQLLISRLNALETKTINLQNKVRGQKIETISDLQTKMIVKERLNDVEEEIKEFNEVENETTKNDIAETLAYSEERFFSAISWMEFFSMNGKKIIVDEVILENSCNSKILEAEDRIQYVGLFLGDNLMYGIRDKVNRAKRARDSGEFDLCLITAAQAKGDANAVISSFGFNDDTFMEVISSKHQAVTRVIAENSQEETFPILGYSYYQYAGSMNEDQKYNALVYLEYALEMSDLSIYFPEEEGEFEKFSQKVNHIDDKWFFLVIGLILGGVVVYLARHISIKT